MIGSEHINADNELTIYNLYYGMESFFYFYNDPFGPVVILYDCRRRLTKGR